MTSPLDHIPQRPARSRRYRGGLPATLRLMRRHMIEGSEQPYVIELVGHIAAQAGATSARFGTPLERDTARMRAVYDWVREHVAYVSDGSGPDGRLREVVRDVEVTLRARAGDCNDHTVLVGALLMAGFDPVQVEGTSVPPLEVYLMFVRDTPVHVFPVALLASGPGAIVRIPMDTAARPGRQFGDLPGDPAPDGTHNQAPPPGSGGPPIIRYALVRDFFFLTSRQSWSKLQKMA